MRIELPAAWKSVETALEPGSGIANTFRAADFDTLVDSPIILGNPVTREFTVDGKRHVLVFEGDTALLRRRSRRRRRAEDRRGRRQP